MGQDLQKKAIESIDSFNSAIATTRMYPAITPQVENAVVHALKNILKFIEEAGSLHIGIENEDILVMGAIVDDKDKQVIQKFVIFKQLNLLQLQHLVFEQGLTAELLKKVILIFTARKEKIIREGGGRQFVEKLGLTANFPETYPYVESENQASKPMSWDSLPVEVGVIAINIVESLDSDEVVITLPPEIEKLLSEGCLEPIPLILQQIADKIEQGDHAAKVRLSRTLCLVGEILLKNGQTTLLINVVEPMKSWLEETDSADFVYEKFVEILQAVSNFYLKTEDLEISKKILTLFKDIRSGVRPKSPPVKALLKRVQERAIDIEIFNVLVAEYCKNPEDSENGQLLLDHGPGGIKYLLEMLIAVDNREQRIQVINLLQQAEEEFLSIVFRYLDKPLTWYGKKNLLILLAEVGDESCADKLIPILDHEDLRVQNEALNCLQKISGSRLKDLLLMGLPVAADPIKVQMIQVLTPVSDEKVADVVIDVLNKQKEFAHDHSESIIIQSSKALANSHAPKALQWLKVFLSKIRNDKSYPQPIHVAVEQAILSLGMALKDVDSNRDEAGSFQITDGAEASTPVLPEANPVVQSITFSPEEKEIRKLFKGGETDRAVELLVKLISACAKSRRFDHANKLRDLLISSSPMSLTEIIQTAELIEEEKAHSINQSNIEVWNDLYDILTPDEFSTLYHSMQHRKYRGNEIIVKQHSMLSAMFFVNSGKVKLFYTGKDGANVLVKVVGRGEIIGVDAFFYASLWTVSAVVENNADVSMLRLERLHEWKEEYPALESKLNDFCLKYESLEQYFKRTAKDRRQDKRFELDGRVSTVLLDKQGNPTKVSSRGDFSDISCGGVSFFMRISKKENSRILLGQFIRVYLPTANAQGKVLNADGCIVAVKAHLAMESEYSIHVKFKEKLSTVDMQTVITALKNN